MRSHSREGGATARLAALWECTKGPDGHGEAACNNERVAFIHEYFDLAEIM